MDLATSGLPTSDPAQLIAEAVIAHRPAVIRDLPLPLELDWVRSDGADLKMLKSRLRDVRILAASTAEDADGIVRYANPDSPADGSTGISTSMTFDEFASGILDRSARPEAAPLFTQIGDADEIIPELSTLIAPFESPLRRNQSSRWNLWMGSGGHRINTHYDESENFYFVLIGSKEFQLFPPEQSRNLYPGPLHEGHGGVTGSLVDAWNPDERAFPRFSAAEDHSVRYRLSAGDMLYLPKHWWHNVASTGINFSANYWWNDVTPRDPCDA
jgi:hypothetical protein